MNPSQKYMSHSRNITDEDDIKLVPFINGRQPPITDQSKFAMSTTGWIPVYFFNNMGPSMANIMPNMSPGMGNMMPNMSPGMGNMMPNMSPGMGNMMPNMSPGMGNMMPNMNLNEDENMNSTKSDLENFYTFNPLTDASKRELPNIIELLSNFDLDLDEDVDLVRNCSDKSIDKIYDKIEKNHPEIFALVRAYNIPYPIFKLLIRRVIKLSISYGKREE